MLIVPLEDDAHEMAGTLLVHIGTLAVIIIESLEKSSYVKLKENTTAVGVTPENNPPEVGNIVVAELHVTGAMDVVYPPWPVIGSTDFDETALNITEITPSGFAASALVHATVAVPAAMPVLPTVIVSTVVVDVLALIALEAPEMLQDGEPDAKTATDAVIVTVSAGSSALVKPTWNSIFERVSPITRLPVNVGTDVHVSMVAVVVYPSTLALVIVDFAETAVKVTDVTAAGFSASPPVHVNVLAPTGIVPPTVNVKTFPLTPAALLLIVTLEDTHTGEGDALGSQIDALAVIFIQSFDKRASVTPIENTTAAGATPATKLPVAVTDELHVNALVVVYPTCPAIEVTDFEDTALNVTVVDDGGFAAKTPVHAIVIAPAAMPPVPT